MHEPAAEKIKLEVQARRARGWLYAAMAGGIGLLAVLWWWKNTAGSR